MSRLDLDPENMLVEQLKKVLSDIEQLKTAQRLGGDSITPYILQSANAYDFTSLDNGSFAYIYLNVKFTADHQLNPYMQPVLRFFDMAGNPLAYSQLSSTSSNYFARDAFESDGLGNIGNFDDGKEYLAVGADGVNHTQFRAKLYLYTSDTGTYEVIQE